MESVDFLLFGLAILIFSGWCFSVFLHFLSIIYGKWLLHRSHPDVVFEDLPGISILKPLVGIDPNLFENLESFFKMKYPNFELLFCIQDEMDASRMIVQSLIDKYPKVDAKMFLGGRNVGINPKINNMAIGYEAAKHDLILISDSGIKMDEDTLVDMAVYMTPNVGLVHQMPYTCTRKGLASTYEKVYFGTQHAKMYLSANVLGINCAVGMSCLMRKPILEEAGGLHEFGQYLAEDFFIAQAFLDRGWRTKVCSRVAQQNSGSYSIPHLHQRLCRWMKLRTAMVPGTSMFWEPISLCINLGLLNAWAVSFLFDISPLSYLLVHILIWFLLDYTMLTVLEKGSIPFSKVDYLVCWCLNEISYPLLMLQSHWDPIITWRGRNFKLKWGGLVEELYVKQTV
ncbi:ceramide glucosyltransferase-like [Mya arenaria]|uniref:ceramide glucosyltransferase-like n=1 Tax=Mya arenaria TaxID=6604 RepID=UPI0022E08ED7|nr:ceramide glucosyltransferase-like [Mya arenaria]